MKWFLINKLSRDASFRVKHRATALPAIAPSRISIRSAPFEQLIFCSASISSLHIYFRCSSVRESKPAQNSLKRSYSFAGYKRLSHSRLCVRIIFSHKSTVPREKRRFPGEPAWKPAESSERFHWRNVLNGNGAETSVSRIWNVADESTSPLLANDTLAHNVPKAARIRARP